MTAIERIFTWGHENIMCTHRTTIEITKDKNMSKQGDCIIGVNASKACIDLSEKLKNQIQDAKKIKVILKVDDIQDCFYGFGNRKLKLLDRNDIVFRKSNFICERTMLVNCSKSSIDVNRDLIKALRNSNKQLSIIFEIDE
ncbi:MAG: DUF371 domain-containing protein [Candidatus Hermodarchaeota archaeon]